MPSKANREKAKAEKEERRRLGRERANESRKKRRANPELHAVEFEASIEVEEKEDWALPDAKWSVGDMVCFEDTRVAASSKFFWESLAVVKSRRHEDSQWLYTLDDLDYERSYLYKDIPERRLKESKYSLRIQHGIRKGEERAARRVATQYENEQKKAVKRLKLKNRLLRKENFKIAQKSLQRDAKIHVLDSQCEKLAREVAEVQNLDFYELLMADRMESKCPLVSYVCNEYQRVSIASKRFVNLWVR